MKKYGKLAKKLQLKVLLELSDNKLHSRYEMSVTNVTVCQEVLSLSLSFFNSFVFGWTVFQPSVRLNNSV